MAFQELNAFNVSAGIHRPIQYVASIVPEFFPFLLFCLFLVFAIGSYLIQKRTTGKGNFFSSLSAASYITTLIAFVMNMIDGLINLYVLVVCVVFSGIFVLIQFFGTKK